MRAIIAIFPLALVATTSSSLLEMSQTLWTKALDGGLTKIGPLDPLRIPIVKVDQSEGNTSYRMILRSVEIRGLNGSSLESIHIGRGPLKSNLSEHEAGYVSYTDQRDIDMIRYRFHTVVKEPKNDDESRNLRLKTASSIRESDKNEDVEREGDKNCDSSSINDDGKEKTSRNHENEEKASFYRDNRRDETGSYVNSQNSQSVRFQADSSRFTAGIIADRPNPRYRDGPKNIPARFVYPENRRFPEDKAASGCTGSCEHRGYESPTVDDEGRNEQRYRQNDDIGTAATSSFQTRGAFSKFNQGRNFEDTRGEIRNDETTNNHRNAGTFDGRKDNRRRYEDFAGDSSSERLEKQPGYVDVLYADGKDERVKHFGNFKVESGRDKSVHSFEDFLKNLHSYNRFIIHNFTEGEALTKKNDAVRIASETKMIKDLTRYAKDFQEKNGYYEQGMYLIYHYGEEDDFVVVDDKGGRRTKRAHLEDDDDDIMHVVMKIHVPMLQVDAGYVLMGNVGKQVLRGNGLLSANFTELIGDFTLELKKVERDTMIVRAARARLSASDKKIKLQGMNEEGPINEILTRGLMAAEAVAAMLADDLTTKALSENTADSIIYKMYKNLPSEK